MSDNENLRLTIEAWAEIVIKIWEDKLRKRKIIHTGELFNSFVYHIYANAGGDPERIIFAFNYYGRFVDMGVGKGVKYDDKGIMKRKNKPWFSATFDYHVEQLTSILEEKYALKISSAIVNTLNE